MKKILVVFAILIIILNPLFGQNNIGTNNEININISKQRFNAGIKPLISMTTKSGSWYSYDGSNFIKSDVQPPSEISIIKIDINGEEYMSYDNGTNWKPTKTASANTQIILKSKLNVFPNPVSTILTVNYESDIFIESADIYIENLIGERILVWKGRLKPGYNEMTIDTQSFASGSYLLIINGMNCIQSKQIRIVK